MLEKLDIKRFNYCLELGRRFYVLCKLFVRHAENIGVDHEVHINVIPEFESKNSDITFSTTDMHESFNPYSTQEGGKHTMVRQIFSFREGDMYINLFENLNREEFETNYKLRYSSTVMDLMFAATQSVFPVELNINSFKIKCSYGDLKALYNIRLPLIETMYRSDEVIEFIKDMISLIMFSSIFHAMIYERSIFNCFPFTYRNFSGVYSTWHPDIFNWVKNFSLEK